MSGSAVTVTGSPLRNIGLLAVAQAVVGSNQAILGAAASLTAIVMVPDRALSTVPVTFMTIGTEVYHFVIALILLGVGWNFGFIASTALLSTAYRPEEAAKVQGLNEQLVFGVMALASILSGVLLNAIGWQSINVLVIPVATLAILALGWGGLSGVRKAASRRSRCPSPGRYAATLSPEGRGQGGGAFAPGPGVRSS